MLHLGICLLTLLVSLPAEARPELELKAAAFATTEHELSGIAKIGNDILLVSDGPEDTFVYRFQSAGKQIFSFEPHIDLAKLDGFKSYVISMQSVDELKKKHRRFDLEGLAHCGTSIYLANERVREIVVIEDGKTLRRLPVDFRSQTSVMEGGSNAGLEGVAADCEKNHLYVAKERDPRILFRVDLKTGKILKAGDVKGSDRQGQKVIAQSGEGLMAIGPDIADLFFDQGHLYLLERNTFEIAKINPETFDVIARVSYLKAEHGLYETGEPFGVAEALLLTADEIIIGFDNNGAQLTHAALKKYGVAGPRGALLYFERPAGF